ncbi:MAG: hypothetical protein D6760_09020 [Deltaproteobacteria bacterium]|nr:MAG: hypothetical protein D6760_09020 [Deltaproteobacteria bacterium]
MYAFAGAFLMFTLEPLVGRLVVPRYGGGFYVWTTCLMFFQGMLLLGYVYAHLLGPRIGRWHLVIAALPLLVLPIDIEAAPVSSHPVTGLLAALSQDVGIPIAVLATTGVLAQAWLARVSADDDLDPYWLYAASNAGSLGGLLAYPFLIEPWMGVASQRLVWTVLYLCYLGLTAAVTPGRSGTDPERAARKPWWEQPDTYLPRSRQLYWFTLSMAPSIMLVAATNAISFTVGSIPLAWVAPLAAYLVSFIVTFRTEPHPTRRLARFWPELGLIGFVLVAGPSLLPAWPTIAWHLLALFALCLAGHGELYRVRPVTHHLTRYYLIVAAGGWAGGVFASIVAPAVFDRLYEYPLALALLATALAASRAPAFGGAVSTGRPILEGLVRVPVASAAIGVSAILLLPVGRGADQEASVFRNHYGVYQVGIRTHTIDTDQGEVQVGERYLMHNGTIHGGQLLVEDGARMHIGYYHPSSGIADALAILPAPRRIAVIGLGTGSTANYLGGGEEVTFYEIDPDGERIARTHFDYLDTTDAFVRVVPGDARIELARDIEAPDHSYDALIVDAFSGDAIPTHLLTREALELYRAKVREDGLLVFHISNRFYDLRGVLRATAAALDLPTLVKRRTHAMGLEPFENATTYMAATTNDVLRQALLDRGWTDASADPGIRAAHAWSDDYVNVLAPLWANLARGSN